MNSGRGVKYVLGSSQQAFGTTETWKTRRMLQNPNALSPCEQRGSVATEERQNKWLLMHASNTLGVLNGSKGPQLTMKGGSASRRALPSLLILARQVQVLATYHEGIHFGHVPGRSRGDKFVVSGAWALMRCGVGVGGRAWNLPSVRPSPKVFFFLLAGVWLARDGGVGRGKSNMTVTHAAALT